MTNAKKNTHLDFKVGETVVYPAQGVGCIAAIEEQEVAGFKLELFVVFFEKEKLTLRVPLAKASSVGLRKLSDPTLVRQALEVLAGSARPKRGMWNRRANEYQEKIASADLIAIAEVARDLYRGSAQEDASFSARNIYEAAIDLLTREIAAVHNSTATEAQKLIEQSLKASQAAKDTKVAKSTEAGVTGTEAA